jgi:hypothetical protein
VCLNKPDLRLKSGRQYYLPPTKQLKDIKGDFMWPFKKPEYIKVQRLSGRPVELADLKAYDDEFKARFDVVQAEVGTDMEAFNKGLLAIDADMKGRYSDVSYVRMPRTKAEFKALISLYGSPVLLAQEQEAPHEVIAVLMDEKFI